MLKNKIYYFFIIVLVSTVHQALKNEIHFYVTHLSRLFHLIIAASLK